MNAKRLSLFAGLWVCGAVRCVGDSSVPPQDAGNDVTSNDVSTPDVSATDASDGGGCGAAPTTTFYVNTATGNDANNGRTASCAFRTISGALTASKQAYNATIKVAAGT